MYCSNPILSHGMFAHSLLTIIYKVHPCTMEFPFQKLSCLFVYGFYHKAWSPLDAGRICFLDGRESSCLRSPKGGFPLRNPKVTIKPYFWPIQIGLYPSRIECTLPLSKTRMLFRRQGYQQSSPLT